MAQSRFELRSKRMKEKTIRQEFLECWTYRWSKAVKTYHRTLERYSQELAKEYQKGLSEFPKPFSNWCEFIRIYQNSIFTREQFIELLNLMEVHDPEEKYKYYMKRYGLLVFDIRQVQIMWGKIQKEVERFFMGEKITLSENQRISENSGFIVENGGSDKTILHNMVTAYK